MLAHTVFVVAFMELHTMVRAGNTTNDPYKKLGDIQNGDVITNYVVSTNNMKWSAAATDCGRRNGSHLAILDHEGNLNQVRSMLQGRDEDFWIGGILNHSDSYWSWLDGQQFDAGSGNCLAIVKGKISAVECNTLSRHYMCIMDGPCNMSQGVVLINQTNRCVRLYNYPDDMDKKGGTWYQSQQKCCNHKAHLFNLSSAQDLNDVRSQTMSNNITHIGVHLRWWWAYNMTNGVNPLSMRYVNSSTEHCSHNQCLTISNAGFAGRPCQEAKLSICQTVTAIVSVDQPSTSNSRRLMIILGTLAAVIVILLIVSTVLVFCIRHAKNKKAANGNNNHSPEGEYQDIDSSTRNGLTTTMSPITELSTANAQAATANHGYVYSEPAIVNKPNVREDVKQGYVYSEAATFQANAVGTDINTGYVYSEAVPVNAQTAGINGPTNVEPTPVPGFRRMKPVNPYATSRIESIIERQTSEKNNSDNMQASGETLHGKTNQLSCIEERDTIGYSGASLGGKRH